MTQLSRFASLNIGAPRGIEGIVAHVKAFICVEKLTLQSFRSFVTSSGGNRYGQGILNFLKGVDSSWCREAGFLSGSASCVTYTVQEVRQACPDC